MKRSILLVCAAMGCVGDIGDPELVAPETSVPEAAMRRLTVHEYNRALRDILGDDTRPAATLLPEDMKTPFDNDYGLQEPSQTLIDAAEILANDAARRLLADVPRRDAIVGCATVDDACMKSFIRHFGRLALRRPLGEQEVEDFFALGHADAVSANDFYAGVELVVRAMLQDARFLYRIEGGTPVPDHPGLFRLDGYDIATRLSFLLWGRTPDDGLLDRAGNGELDTPDGVKRVAVAMLEDARAREQIDRFHALWLGYDALPHPQALTDSMRHETAALIGRVVFDEKAPWRGVFLMTESFLDDELAVHYGLPPPGAPAWVDVSSQGRKGLLSHGSFLSVASNIGDTSPTKRGKLIRERLMCEPMLPPPPGVNTDAPTSTSECKIDQYESHSQGSCATCHEQMDPIGFGLENYDVAGRFRAHDADKPQCVITGEGELVGHGTFRGPAELADRLVETGLLEACAVEHLARYVLGRELRGSDRELADILVERFGSSGGRFGELLVAIVSDETFGFRRDEPR